MNTIKLDFSDFWPCFDKEHNYFTDLLRTVYDVKIHSQPDFLIYSTFGRQFRQSRCIRIFYTGECIEPDYDECDFSFDFELEDIPDHYRLPHFALYGDVRTLIRESNPDLGEILARAKKFCSFVVSNPRGQERIDFFRRLSSYKQVDSAGALMNNVGEPVRDKLEFMRQYKFSIAFENQHHPGYTTEKLYQALQAGGIPIYWGNPAIGKDFDTRRFINCHEYPDMDAVVRRVIEVDQNDELYGEYLRQPCYPNNVVPECVRPENILRQFKMIFEASRVPVAQRKSIKRCIRRIVTGCRRRWWGLSERLRR